MKICLLIIIFNLHFNSVFRLFFEMLNSFFFVSNIFGDFIFEQLKSLTVRQQKRRMQQITKFKN